MKKRLFEKWEKVAIIAIGAIVAYKMRSRIIKGIWASKTALEDIWEEIKAEVEKEKGAQIAGD